MKNVPIVVVNDNPLMNTQIPAAKDHHKDI